MAHLNLDDISSLEAKVNEKAYDLFKANPGKSQLEVGRLQETELGEEKAAVCFMGNQYVEDLSQLKALKHESSSSHQVFIIRQDRSWTTLNISRELFEDFLAIYSVFPQFWKFVFTFGRKSSENEFEFPGFRARRSLSNSKSSIIYEFACILRRVELNHRKLSEGQSPWSIRQTAVYHKYIPIPNPVDPHPPSSDNISQEPNSMLLLIAPSQTFEMNLSRSFELGVSDKRAIAPWNIIRMLVADSLKGWMEYMAWQEEQLKEQSNRIILATIGTEKDNLSQLTNFNITDRQALELLGDSIINLQVILSTMSTTISRINEMCKRCCERHCGKKKGCDCDIITQEFHEHIEEVEMYNKRAKILGKSAKRTTQLLMDLLSYEEAMALKDLAQESQLENKSIYSLTEKSTKDAAAVKILTVIGLIYLPTTLVANFFSTQFIRNTEDDSLRVSNNAWLLAAIAVPLTVFTVALWWTWVHCAVYKNSDRPYIRKAKLKSHLRSWLMSRKRQRPNDVEGLKGAPSI